MFGHQYSHGVMRKYVIMFGNLFNDIEVQRFNASDQRIQTLKVPIAYGPKEKFLVRISQDPDLDRDVAIQLPRLGFEMSGMVYSPTRKLTSTQKNYHILPDGDTVRRQYVPVPYDISFQLGIFVRNADDGVQILEQILPFFRPEWTSQVRVIPDMSLIMDIPTVLQGVSLEDTYEGDFDTRRAIIWTLDFLVKGWIYGPITNSGLIKRTLIDFYTPFNSPTANVSTQFAANTLIKASEIGVSQKVERIRITPGLVVNSTGRFATTNSTASVAIDQITANDDFGFATDFFHYDGDGGDS
jgi:hypothetical protein